MGQMISVTYEVDEGCYLRACDALWRHQAIGHRQNVWVGFVVGTIGICLFWYELARPIAILAIVGGGLLVLLSSMRRSFWRWHYKRLDKYQRPITTTFRDDDLEVVLNGQKHPVLWDMFSSYAVTSEFLFLIIDKTNFSIIPRNAFEQPAAFNCVLEIVTKHLPELRKRKF